ncbi:putative vacuolar (H+)-ATPase G subunit [Helianthus debilis subsp. tardiflorus]
MKQAKDEAEEEVAKYRAHMEKEYQKTVSESTGFSGMNVKRLDEETVKKIDHLKKQPYTRIHVPNVSGYGV